MLEPVPRHLGTLKRWRTRWRRIAHPGTEERSSRRSEPPPNRQTHRRLSADRPSRCCPERDRGPRWNRTTLKSWTSAASRHRPRKPHQGHANPAEVRQTAASPRTPAGTPRSAHPGTLLPFLPGPSKQRSFDAFHHSFLRPRIANSTPILVSIASLSTRYSKRRPGRLALSLGAVRRSSFEQCGESVWDFARCSVGRTACRRCGRVGCANGSVRLALQLGLGGNLIHPLPRAVDRQVNITQKLQRPLKCFARLTEARSWARSKTAKKASVECITLCLTFAKTGKISQLNQYVINWRWRQSRANSSPPNSLLNRENTGNFREFGRYGGIFGRINS